MRCGRESWLQYRVSIWREKGSDVRTAPDDARRKHVLNNEVVGWFALTDYYPGLVFHGFPKRFVRDMEKTL